MLWGQKSSTPTGSLSGPDRLGSLRMRSGLRCAITKAGGSFRSEPKVIENQEGHPLWGGRSRLRSIPELIGPCRGSGRARRVLGTTAVIRGGKRNPSSSDSDLSTSLVASVNRCSISVAKGGGAHSVPIMCDTAIPQRPDGAKRNSPCQMCAALAGTDPFSLASSRIRDRMSPAVRGRCIVIIILILSSHRSVPKDRR